MIRSLSTDSHLVCRLSAWLALSSVSAALLELGMPASAVAQTLLQVEVKAPTSKPAASERQASPAPSRKASTVSGNLRDGQNSSTLAASEVSLEEKRSMAWPFIQVPKTRSVALADKVEGTKQWTRP